MPGPFEAAGQAKDPTKFAALTMQGEQFSGIWTQRSPYRDAATAYLVKKFYQGSRIDSMLDGLNREIYMDLTDGRRPGMGVYNSAALRQSASYYSFKRIQNGVESIRVISDQANGTINDVTGPSGSDLLFANSGAGPARFQGVGTSLYVTGSYVPSKWLDYAPWLGSTTVTPGTLINSGSSGGNVFMALGGITLAVIAIQQFSSFIYIYIDPANIPANFPNLQNVQVTWSGLTAGTFLNGTTTQVTVVSTTLGILSVVHAASSGARVATGGSGTTGTGITGGTIPSFNTSTYGLTADGTQQWKCYGTGPQNWTPLPPKAPPVITPVAGTRYWSPNATLSLLYAVLDSNQNVQVVWTYTTGAGGVYITGQSYPAWTGLSSTTFAQTIDGTIVWLNFGPPGTWKATTAFGNLGQIQAILDSNQNLQIVTNGTGANSGSSAPTWATTIGTTTTDGGLTWTCLGPGVQVTTESVQYAFALHSVDGTVTTCSPATTIQGPILSKPLNISGPLGYLDIAGTFPLDTGSFFDQVMIFRCPQGQIGTMVLEDRQQIDTQYAGLAFFYVEMGIPDTSAAGGGALNAFVPAPTAHSNDPLPQNATAPCFHLQRIWAIVDNTVVYSGGPETITGNGTTAFPPGNVIPFNGRPIKLRPVLVQNGGLIVYTTSGIWIILGIGTSDNPFAAWKYAEKINLGNYNAEDINGSLLFLMESNGRVSSLEIQYPFNPQSGYTEIGFPIGDQFLKVTTGGFQSSLFNPATAYLTWHIANTTDIAMYVADGAIGWFRMSQIMQPESGYLWSPFAAIQGGTSAVQSIETSPGKFQLLCGSHSFTGPILARDQTGTVWTDNTNFYPSWDVKGVILLCTSGEIAEIGWLSSKSKRVGQPPTWSFIMGEIDGSAVNKPFHKLRNTGNDPNILEPSQTVYSHQYDAQQGGVTARGDCVLLKIDYGTQPYGDRLLDFGIYGSVENQR